jgi:hypothetical protein
MSQNFDLLDVFAEHETIVFDVTMYDRAGAALGSPETATITMAVTSDENRDTAVFDLAIGATEIQLSSGSTFQFKVPDNKAALLTPGTVYYFDIWSITAADGRMHQVDGSLRLRRAGKEA